MPGEERGVTPCRRSRGVWVQGGNVERASRVARRGRGRSSPSAVRSTCTPRRASGAVSTSSGPRVITTWSSTWRRWSSWTPRAGCAGRRPHAGAGRTTARCGWCVPGEDPQGVLHHGLTKVSPSTTPCQEALDDTSGVPDGTANRARPGAGRSRTADRRIAVPGRARAGAPRGWSPWRSRGWLGMDEARLDEIRLAVGEICACAVRRSLQNGGPGDVLVESTTRAPPSTSRSPTPRPPGTAEEESVPLPLVRGWPTPSASRRLPAARRRGPDDLGARTQR